MSSIFLHKNGVYRYEGRVPGRDRPIRKSLKTKVESKAKTLQKQLDKYFASGASVLPPTRTRSTLSGLLAKYKESPPKGHSAATRAYYAAGVKLWADWGGADRLGAIERVTVEEFAAHLERAGRRPVSVNTALRALKCFVGLAIRRKWHTGDNPFAEWEPVREAVPLRKPLSREQVGALLDAATGDAKLIIALGYYTGMRIGEILAARWPWVDWDARCIHVISDETFRTKSGKSRTIPLNSRLAAILEAHRKPGGFIVRPGRQPGKGRYRFDSRACIRAAVKASGIEAHVYMHLFRHTFGSVLSEADVEYTKIRRWLGHADKGVTDKYIHLKVYSKEIEKL